MLKLIAQVELILGVHTFSIVSYIRGYLVLEVIDTSKFRYETGYKTIKKVRLTKNKTFKFRKITYDVSGLNGIDSL